MRGGSNDQDRQNRNWHRRRIERVPRPLHPTGRSHRIVASTGSVPRADKITPGFYDGSKWKGTGEFSYGRGLFVDGSADTSGKRILIARANSHPWFLVLSVTTLLAPVASTYASVSLKSAWFDSATLYARSEYVISGLSALAMYALHVTLVPPIGSLPKPSPFEYSRT